MLEKERAFNKDLTRELSDYAPVPTDSWFGASSERSDFADTGWHLSRSGLLKRSKDLKKALAGLTQRQRNLNK